LLPYAGWLVWIFPTLSSLLVPVFDKLGGKAKGYFAVLTSLITAMFGLSIATDVYFGRLTSSETVLPWLPQVGINAGIFMDSLSVLFANLIAFFSFVVILYSLDYMEGEEGQTRYYFFMLLFTGSMIGLVMAGNFLQLFIFWEMVSLCSYSLVSFWNKLPKSVYGGIKVFLMTRLGDVCLLAGIALLYNSVGSFSFSSVIANIESVPLPALTAIAFLFLVGAIAKSAQLPFNTWLYAAMEAPTSVSAFLHSATMVKAGVYLIARMFILFGPLMTSMPTLLSSLAWIGAATALVGAILALSTPDIKGVAASSTTSQIGFMFAALGTATSSSSLGWYASLLLLVSHAFFQGLDFLLIGGIVHEVGTRDMRLMGDLRKTMPVTFGLSVVVLLARTGIPPFTSFFGKEFIAGSLWATDNVFPMLMIYVTMALTFAYSLRAITLTFVRRKSENLWQTTLHEPQRLMIICSGVLAVSCVGFSFFGNAFAQFMHVNFEIGLVEVLNPSTLVFVLALFSGGLAVYLVYYRQPFRVQDARLSPFSPLLKYLENGYFLDILYEGVVAKGILKASASLRRIELEGIELIPHLFASGVLGVSHFVQTRLEKAFFDRIPYDVAVMIMRSAHYTHVYLDIFVDDILYAATKRTISSASRVRKVHSFSLPHFVAAALLGFFILLILVVVTMLG
jgi:NADH-quinone oxidoreductase subunit L